MKYKSLVAVLLLGIVLSLVNSCKMKEIENEEILFVGTYTNNGSEGIYRYNFNLETGQLENKTLAATIKNPSYLTLSPDKNTMYVVSEVDNFNEDNGSITTFRVKDTVLIEVDVKSTYGANPCYVGVNESGDLVAVANYTGGNVAVYSAAHNGNLNPSPQIIDHKILDTTKTAHAHMAEFINGELFVSDLGLDRIEKYRKTDGQFSTSEQKELVVAEGAGPRHFVSSNDEKFIYVINELNSTITVFGLDDEKYYAIETQETTASNFDGESFCADIHLSSDGKFLYGTNRGENTIVIFEVDQATGKLKLLGRESVKGDWPRNFSIDPTENFILVANQRSNNIVVFKRNIELGTLSFVSQVDLPSPVCLKFN
tara:strand:+ start:655 stop:1764 length:1110 start_codon:yes stop_codon:yes gene_type:complete